MNIIYENYKILLFIKKLKCYKYKFKNEWIIWYHKINDNNWNIDSYKKLYKFNNIYDFWRLYNNFEILEGYMFFLMKNNIEPRYEHKNNKLGGYWSLKIDEKNGFNIWKNLTIDLITLNLENKKNIINGLSIIKKKNFYIIKIWIKDIIYNNKDDINLKYKIYQKYTKQIIFSKFF